MFAKILCFALLLFFANEGLALKCYLCVGGPRSDCSRGIRSSMVQQPCTQRETPTILQKNHYEEHENELDEYISASCVSFLATVQNMTVYERGCGYVPQNVDICKYLAKVTKLTSCKSCTRDLCNA